MTGIPVTGIPVIEPATPETITRAASLLQSGALVAFPTETVYGLGADATSDDAVARIFDAKQRPTFNPPKQLRSIPTTPYSGISIRDGSRQRRSVIRSSA